MKLPDMLNPYLCFIQFLVRGQGAPLLSLIRAVSNSWEIKGLKKLAQDRKKN